MSVLQRLKNGMVKFMAGRRGPDELSLALLVTGLALSLLSSILRLAPLYYIGLAGYVLALFRMLSRNLQKRYAENAKFVSIKNKWTMEVKHFFNRLKNMRKYKYYKCPQCHARLRLPRKVGEVTVTCGKCHHVFKKKA